MVGPAAITQAQINGRTQLNVKVSVTGTHYDVYFWQTEDCAGTARQRYRYRLGGGAKNRRPIVGGGNRRRRRNAVLGCGVRIGRSDTRSEHTIHPDVRRQAN